LDPLLRALEHLHDAMFNLDTAPSFLQLTETDDITLQGWDIIHLREHAMILVSAGDRHRPDPTDFDLGPITKSDCSLNRLVKAG